MIEELVKNFEHFCRMCDGKFSYSLFPECKRLSYTIGMDFHELDNKLEYLTIKIISSEGDFEIFSLKDIYIEKIERLSENDENGNLAYYSLFIYTNKGVLSLKRAIRENKLIVSFSNEDLNYQSSVIF